ncbi:neutral/alkaline non-lysosomal ceramidase N-terminal domain-containing protein [Paenibacillus nasutitermitis]|uniref:Neutral/alkaline non-lysosomal ceramidase N-terminal domain-containing protein n=1 Tax=Paenibacillus nasutitermitis TaxID=1652958 RepID=A0A916Z6A2_9BACL|nr:neutral/alkaline non-lysosomal ceramidase N-terminal domain-containing protein [Paenibacillus nasutitermitis]GGD78447.1 hypothetical protein GCM10010911_40610 [Paenibacillus nasutitermitis]
MESVLYLGTEKIDITPTFPVSLAGFASRSSMGPAEDVSHPLYARIFVFESRNNGDAQRSLLISADLLWWGSDRVPDLKRRIHSRFGIEEAAILLHGTHTHSGPQTSLLFTSYLGQPDLVYLAKLEEHVLDGIEQALANLEPVRAERGTGQSLLGINRRGLRKSPPKTDEVDHELNVIRFTDLHDTPKAVFIHYACHPVITNENKFSSEYIGVAMETVEQQYGNGVVAGFLQGTCGDINPGDGQIVIRGTDEQVIEVGLAFAGDVLRVLDKPMTPLTGCRLQWRSETVELPLAALPDKQTLEDGLSLPDVHGEWHRIQLDRFHGLKQTMPLELTWLKLAEECSFLAMNAEIVVEYGLYLKRLSKGRILPIAYTNGMFGYVPTAAQLQEGGYESYDSTYYFAMPAVFDPKVEQVLKNALDGFLK